MKRRKHPEHINHERWLISYADFITLLFAFFVVMFAVSRVDTQKLGRFSQSFSEAMGLIDEGAQGVLPGAGDSVAGEPQPGVNATRPGDEVIQVREELARQQREAPGEALAKIKVVQRRNELVLRLDDNVVFDSGDDRVREQAQQALRAVAALIKGRQVELRVEGHTDNVPVRNGRFRSNWELSTARATAVIAELAQSGLAPERLSAAGYGEFHPVGPNDTPEARAHNRRVDLVISGGLAPAAEQALEGAAAPAASAPAAAHDLAPTAPPADAHAKAEHEPAEHAPTKAEHAPAEHAPAKAEHAPEAAH